MVEHNTAVMGNNEALDEAKKKEEYEYFEARNRQDIAEKQVDFFFLLVSHVHDGSQFLKISIYKNVSYVFCH